MSRSTISYHKLHSAAILKAHAPREETRVVLRCACVLRKKSAMPLFLDHSSDVHEQEFLKIYSLEFDEICQNYYSRRILDNGNITMEV